MGIIPIWILFQVDIEGGMMFKRIPNHIGIIPDGNRRWAQSQGMEKKDGYSEGIPPGLRLFELLTKHGVQEVTFYGFTKDNNKRPVEQRQAFSQACVEAVELLKSRNANLLVIGNDSSPAFPEELKPYANKRVIFKEGGTNVNFLVNYDWGWDLKAAQSADGKIASSDIPRVDLLIRWGGMRRLSGFLPVQSVYADFYIIDDYWPDFQDKHFLDALSWYQNCDVTLGG